MENQETPKRKYKKHKDGFKVTINHKLNTSVKSFIPGSERPCPLYVEVRVHRQRSFFPSQFDFHVYQNDFDSFLKNEFVQKFLIEESLEIGRHIEQQAKSKDTFDITEWLSDYKKTSKAELFNFFLFDYSNRLFQSHALGESILPLVDGRDWLRSLKNITAIFKYYGETSFSNLHDIIVSYEIIENIVGYYSSNWLMPEIDAKLNLDRSITVNQILDTNFLRDKLAIMEESDPEDYLSNMERIREFITRVDKNV
ncbi:hypothetical protein SAMN04487995_6040 [Dyadobacter koreensis]|uniref:Uncharacterized protein n=1 Tax=Dyadobacter koreensis TaxID=408657 RepID=A0A1H7B4H9_9BACT|nr:hypothetical protein [Dyadobacter koreensis]SEJ71157.1 hypothetical protein SAMN04487995_6040 [Dyadobacter koreensis]